MDAKFAVIPSMAAAFMGFGTVLKYGDIINALVHGGMHAVYARLDLFHESYQLDLAKADKGDCISTQHGLARMFCDLYCVRDAVRKGDKLILETLKSVVDTLNKNLKELFSHYLGEETGTDDKLAQILMQGEQMVKAGLTELEAVAKGAILPPMASADLRHVAMSFGAGWQQRKQAMIADGTNNTHHVRALLDETVALFTVVQASTSERLSPAEAVQQRVLLYVADTNQKMHAKLQSLDLYRQYAVHSKHLQQVLLKSAAAKPHLEKNQELSDNDLIQKTLGRQQKQKDREQEVRRSDLSVLERLEMKMDGLKRELDEQREVIEEQRKVMEEKDVSRELAEMDSLWWQMRIQFDKYLDAADGQLKAFKAALKALQAYTSECTTNFAGIKDAFATSARVEHQTHAVLKEVWTTVVPLMGVLTAKVEDNADLLLFAQADVRAVDFRESFGLNTRVGRDQFCTDREKQKAVAEKVVGTAIQNGIYGQALRQLQVTFGHLVMLEDRFFVGGLGKAPNAEALVQAAKRLKGAKKAVDETIPALSEWLVKRVVGLCQAAAK